MLSAGRLPVAGIWGGLLLAALLLGGADALLAYEAGPLVAAAVPLATVAAVAIVRRPLLGVYAALLAIPLETLALRLGGDAGVSVTEGLLLLTALAAAVRFAWSGRPPRPDPAHLAFAGLLVLVALGYFVAADIAIVTKILAMWTSFLVVSLLVSSASPGELERILGCVAIAGGLVGALALLGAEPQQLSAGGTLATNRAQASFAHPNVLSFFLVLTIAPALVLATRGSAGRRALMFGAFALAIGGLALSLSRSGYVAISASLLVLLFWTPFRRVAIAAVVVFAVTVASGADPLPRSAEVATVTTRLGTLVSSEKVTQDPRIEIWEVTRRMIADQPLLGTGAGNFPNVSERYGLLDSFDRLPFEHAHSIPLTVAAELGVPALALLIVFSLLVGRTAVRALRRRDDPGWPLALGVTAALAAALTTGLGDYPPRTNVIMATFLIEVGVLIGYARLARARTPP